MPQNPNSLLETAVIGGGCFWCTEAIFSRLKGVEKVTSGYAGGEVANPSYEKVSLGITNHAEVIELQFDPQVITYGQLLEIFWNTHDPTTLNQQGADVGTQYRSIIFHTTDSQKQIAEKMKTELQTHFPTPVVTKIEPLKAFYSAEAYHQKYFDRQPDQPYCEVVISPKIQKLFTKYPHLLK